MKKLIINLLFDNEEREIINSGLVKYTSLLQNIKNQTARDQSIRASKLRILFKFKKEKDDAFPLIN